MRLAFLFILLASACGGDSYRWYCEELQSTPSTWVLTPQCPVPTLTLRLAQKGAISSCQDGSCTCTVSPWDFGHYDLAGGFTSHDPVEACFATADCTFANGENATLKLVTIGPGMTAYGSAATKVACDSYIGKAEAP